MKRWSLVIATLIALPAFAQQLQASAAPTDAMRSASLAQAQSQAQASTRDRLRDRHCLRETGSLVTASSNARERRTVRDPAERKLQCASAFGRAYSREDIERTGAITIRDALRTLDPSVY